MTNFRIDNLQYCNWSKQIFDINHDAKLDAIHVTIAYHEDFNEVKKNISDWERHFKNYEDIIMHGRSYKDISLAHELGKTAVFFGFQNCSPISDNIGLVEEIHKLGIVFMQLTYNNQSLLASGCYEDNDSGVTRMGKEVIKEMNRLGIVIDMSHSAEQSTLDAINLSTKPIAITHANPSFWLDGKRSKSNRVLKALAKSDGMLGFSLYPHHLKGKRDCSLNSFCEMVARTVDMIGIKHVGIGSDLCTGHPDSVVEWMRNGKWTKNKDYGEGSAMNAGFPEQPSWFKDARGFENLEKGLFSVGFQENEVNDILGNNWYNFYRGINS